MDNLALGFIIATILWMGHQHVTTFIHFRNRRKEMQDNHRRQIELFESYNKSIQQPSLEQQLQEALDRQDYEEAARIRNLMGKK